MFTTRCAGEHRVTEKKKNKTPCLRASNDQREWVVKKESRSKSTKALDSTRAFGHERSYIQSELVNPIYAAGNPRITSNPKPSGWGASPHRYAGKKNGIFEPQRSPRARRTERKKRLFVRSCGASGVMAS